MRDLGVLFVHGIGSQTQGRTLADWGQALVAWINRWTQSALRDPKTATISDAFLPPHDSGPAHAYVDVCVPVESGTKTSHWILAEAWWASTVLPPSFSELARWAFVVVPSTIASHFLIRVRRIEITKGSPVPAVLQGLPYVRSFFSLAAAMVAMPFLILGLALILLLGLIPINRVQELAGAVQRALANTLGDSLALLGNAVQEAAIVGGVRRDLEWLSERCKKVVVVAHSQGAAVAHFALERTTADNVTLFVTFGSGIGKLLETRRLMNGGESYRWWGPWSLSIGAALLFVGLWRSLPGLWLILDSRMLRYALAYFVFIALASPPKLPNWLKVTFFVLALIPLLLFWAAWFNRSATWLFMFIGGFVLFTFGLEEAAVDTTTLKRTRPPSVKKGWLDLFGSRDPVPNGAFFESNSSVEGRSEEVAVLRSIFSDHTAYWSSAEDFVPHVVETLTGEAEIDLKSSSSGDEDWLKRSRTRRRWRIAALAVCRTAMLAAPVMIVGTQGVSVERQAWKPAEPSTAMPIGLRIQNTATDAVLDVADAVTPGVVKRWTGSQDPLRVQSATGAASLMLVLMLTWLAFRLILWRWRAWDRAEVERFFDRKRYRVLEPHFVVFLFTTFLVFEAVAVVAAGWAAQLRAAPTPLLRLVLINTLIFAFLAGSPWMLRLVWSFLTAGPKVAVIARGLAATAVAVLAVTPIFIRIATTLVGHDPKTLENSNLMEPAGLAVGAILVVVWGVPLFKLWSRLEQHVAKWTGATANQAMPPPQSTPAQAGA